MNEYIKNLNRIEFVITLSCTGTCRHCSQGGHSKGGAHIDGGIGAEVVRELCSGFEIESVMTFGGEPLLFADDVCCIHSAAKEKKVPKRQIITNGFFHKDEAVIEDVAVRLKESGVNDILLSVDAFHQETIPLEPVKLFAKAVKAVGILLRTQPAWLVSEPDDNPYNRKTREILKEFEQLGISASSGNVIFPAGNAVKYLKEYFKGNDVPENPYEEDPEDIRAICVSENGDVLGGNIYRTNIMKIVDGYRQERRGQQ